MAMNGMSVELQFVEGVEFNDFDENDLQRLIDVTRTALISEVADATLARLDQDLCVRLCDAEESQSLNSTYRDRAYPTNVLSFAGDADAGMLGDLAVCVAVLVQEADEQNKPVSDHTTHLVLHGVLHLLGFDHERDDDADEMERLEIKVLAALGIGNPYRVADGAQGV